MRNLKKYIYVIVIVLMVLSVTIPIIATALESTFNNRQEQKVNTITPTPTTTPITTTDNDAEIFIVQDEDPPLAMFESSGPVWAVANLVLAAAGVALAVMMGIRAIAKDKSYDYDDYDGFNDYEEEEEDYKTSKKILAFAITILAILGTVLFLLTQDMTLTMRIVDSWTLAQASLFAAGLFSYIFLSRKKKDKCEHELNEVI